MRKPLTTTSTLAGILPNQWFTYGEGQAGMVIRHANEITFCVLYNDQDNTLRYESLSARLEVAGYAAAIVTVKLSPFDGAGEATAGRAVPSGIPCKRCGRPTTAIDVGYVLTMRRGLPQEVVCKFCMTDKDLEKTRA